MTSGLRLELEGKVIYCNNSEEYEHYRFVDIQCAPDQVGELKRQLAGQGIKFSVMIKNIQTLADLVPMKKGVENK